MRLTKIQRNWLMVATMSVACLIEFGGGLKAKSLVLSSDAMHVLTDIISYFLTGIITECLVRKNADKENKYRGRLGLVSGLLLCFSVVWILMEAIERLMTGTSVNAVFMIWMAVLGTIFNLIALCFMGGEHLNVTDRANWRHLLSDFFHSLVVIIGGIAISLTDFYLIDPILSIFISGLLLYWSYKIISESWFLLRRAPHSF